jgi:predicted short-subunit dehydrogenase-like oxidoreductase (DUF2520 family)
VVLGSNGPVAVVGAGRLGSVLHDALAAAGVPVTGPHGRGFDGDGAAVVVLCVPDGAIAAAARAITRGPLVGHCSGATSLEAIRPHRAFSLHPVMTFVPGSTPDVFRGVAAAIAGTDPEAFVTARLLATAVGMLPFDVAESDRVAYHAATAMAANFLVTLEEAAGRLITTADVDRSVLAPLARAALDNWVRSGPAALTGPIARGDEAVVDAHRDAIADRAPHLLPMFDALAAATRDLVGRAPGPAAGIRRAAS